MRVLLVDTENLGLDFAIRCAAAGHDVRWWLEDQKLRDGEGFKGFQRVKSWKDHMPWAKDGLILCTGNHKLLHEFDRFRDLGYRIFAPTAASARLEIDRAAGMKAMEEAGIEIPPYQTFESLAAAAKFARKVDKPFVFKTMGDEEDKSLSYVASDPADLVGWIEQKIRRGVTMKGACMLQERIDMLAEVGVSGWFGPDGFLPGKWQICFEHKKLMNGEIGPNCYSEDTEVLTEDGWKRFDQVSKSDLIASYNPETGGIFYERPTALHWTKGPESMVHFKNRYVDILVTPGHQMYAARRKTSAWKFYAASQTPCEFEVLQTAKTPASDKEYFTLPEYMDGRGYTHPALKIPGDAWAAFMGIYLSEGSCAPGGAVKVAQIPGEKRDAMRAVMLAMPFRFCEPKNVFKISSVQLANYLKKFGTSRVKYVPDFIKTASARQIDIFLHWFCMGDGDWHEGRRRYHSASWRLISDIQELMLKIGLTGAITEDCRAENTVFAIEESTRKKVAVKRKAVVPYSGMVGYVTLPTTHLLFVRRNGRVAICGNTGEQGTVCQYVETDKLAQQFLIPMVGALRRAGHRGDFAIGCGIDKAGKAWPFEFTARLGWPCFFIQVASHKGDPAQWMRDLLDGKDTLKVSNDVAIGVVCAQPHYPYNDSPPELVEGNPISGLDAVYDDIHCASVMIGKGPTMKGGKIVDEPIYETSDEYVLVATSLGKTVTRARKKVYGVVDEVKFKDMIYRTDIGEKVVETLPALHRFGYAMEMQS